MEDHGSARLVTVETLNEGLVIRFGDGKCAFYSAFLLYAIYPQAEEMDETDVAW